MITRNNLLWYSLKKQLEWENHQDWTGYTKEQREEIVKEKGMDIWRELIAKYHPR